MSSATITAIARYLADALPDMPRESRERLLLAFGGMARAEGLLDAADAWLASIGQRAKEKADAPVR